MAQAVRLKRSEKTYLAGMRALGRKLNEEARELNWLDKNIEFIQSGNFRALRTLFELDR